MYKWFPGKSPCLLLSSNDTVYLGGEAVEVVGFGFFDVFEVVVVEVVVVAVVVVEVVVVVVVVVVEVVAVVVSVVIGAGAVKVGALSQRLISGFASVNRFNLENPF